MQLLETRSLSAIHFTDDDGPAIAEHDLARADPVGIKIDEGTDSPFIADDLSDDVLTKAILQGHDVTVAGKIWPKRQGGSLGMVRLHREEDLRPGALKLRRCKGRGCHHHRCNRPEDAHATVGIADCSDVLELDIHKGYIVPGAFENRAYG